MKPYYERGGITIYHGDCREILPQLGRFDLCLTDPPYGIGFAAQPTDYQRAKGKRPEAWDDEAPDISHIFTSADEFVIWGGNYYALPASRGWMIWYKPDSPPSMGDFEMAWTSKDCNAEWLSCSISSTNPERVGHPTQKPIRVINWCLSRFPNASTVIDPYCGSGTTLVAAKTRGLKAVGIEREERYCEIAAQRLAQDNLFGDI